MAVCEEGARIEAIARRVAAAAGFQRLKQEQVQAWLNSYAGAMFSSPFPLALANLNRILPAVIEIARGRPPKMSIALVISPFSAQPLMLDQKSRFIPSGITAREE